MHFFSNHPYHFLLSSLLLSPSFCFVLRPKTPRGTCPSGPLPGYANGTPVIEVNVELFSNIINFVNRQLSSEETIYSQNVFPKIRQPAAIAPFHSILTTKSLRKSFAQVIAFETADWSRPVVRIRGIFRLFVQLICANSQCHL